jgi:23S rRNA (guanosine2251-2'-O)-methyltransferase
MAFTNGITEAMRVIYGVNPVLEAIKAGSAIRKVVISERRSDRVAGVIKGAALARGIEVEKAAKEALDRMAGHAPHQGVVALMRSEYRYADIDGLVKAWRDGKERALFVVLDSVQDPQNLGSIIRTSYAAGAGGIIVPRDRAALVTPAVEKASAGAAERALIAREVNMARSVERLKEEGLWVIAVEAGCDRDIYSVDMTGDIALVLGGEGRGIRRLVREGCDFQASIPMAGALNSLNAAQAAAIALFEARRQRLLQKG